MYVPNTAGVLFDPPSLLVVKDKGSSGDNNDGLVLKERELLGQRTSGKNKVQ